MIFANGILLSGTDNSLVVRGKCTTQTKSGILRLTAVFSWALFTFMLTGDSLSVFQTVLSSLPYPVNFKRCSFYLAVETGCTAKCELIPSIRILPTSFLSRDTSTIYLSFIQNANLTDKTPWRNGSASDSRSEGCLFKSRRGQSQPFVYDNGFT